MSENHNWVEFASFSGQIVYRYRTVDQPDGSQHVEYQRKEERQINIEFSFLPHLIDTLSEFSKNLEDDYIYSFVEGYDQAGQLLIVGHTVIGWLPLTGEDRKEAVRFRTTRPEGL